jgi:hypothetical protein
VKKKWYVRARRGEVNVDGFVHAKSPTQALLLLVKRKRVWPKRAYVHLEHFPGGHTYWAWPTWKVGNGMSLGDLWVARIIPEEEFGEYGLE